MCIIFISLDLSGKYKFILAANRDEYYDRPSKPADFWYANDYTILSGLDMKSGKEGGTWLGMNMKGKIAAITNYMEPVEDENAKGRGSLVSDYLISDTDRYEYLNHVAQEGSDYNGFNLITASFDRKSDGLCYYSNRSNLDGPINLGTGIYGICNSLLDTPWNKLCYGKSAFTEIINNAEHVTESTLITQLLHLLNDDKPTPLDPAIEEQGKDFIRPIMQEYSAICVRANGYGTRTNTIILIDENYNVNFTERTMLNENINEWKTSNYIFALNI